MYFYEKFIFCKYCIYFILFSCQKEQPAIPTPTVQQPGIVKSAAVEAGLKFKHNGCNNPFGICITKPISDPRPKPPEPLWSAVEVGQGWGSAYLSIAENGQMKIVPLRRAHNNSLVVPVTDDIVIDEELAALLGYNSITILEGNYAIDLEVGNGFGEFYVDISTN